MPKVPKAKVGQNKKPIHPHSRKAMVLARNMSHDKRLQKSKSEKNSKLDILVDKMLWFQTKLSTEMKISSKAELAELTEKYFQRFQQELEQIRIINGIANRRGVRHASRESSIRMTLGMERSQFEGCGFEVPNLIDEENCKILKEWDGQSYGYLPRIKMIKISADDVVMETKANLSTCSHQTVKPKQTMKTVAETGEKKKEGLGGNQKEEINDIMTDLEEIDEDALLQNSDNEDVEMTLNKKEQC